MVEIPNSSQTEQIYELMRKNAELEEMIAGAMQKEKELLNTITNIAEVIYYQSPLSHQDSWLESLIMKGMWTPENDPPYDSDRASEMEANVCASSDSYIYESPDGGKTIYRRKFGCSTKEKIR
tara:strand:- start:6630 stop:6998 length:369 start_codon:yes stop_codon:yes gene_type:complete